MTAHDVHRQRMNALTHHDQERAHYEEEARAARIIAVRLGVMQPESPAEVRIIARLTRLLERSAAKSDEHAVQAAQRAEIIRSSLLAVERANIVRGRE